MNAKQVIIGASWGAFVLAIVGVVPASAQTLSNHSCFELWLDRNEIFHKVGYCFKSKKGKANFPNADCHRNSQEALNAMGANNRRLVERIKREESRRGC